MVKPTVIIVGMRGPFDMALPPNAEVWGCNQSYMMQDNLSRLYAMDDLEMAAEETKHRRHNQPVVHSQVL